MLKIRSCPSRASSSVLYPCWYSSPHDDLRASASEKTIVSKMMGVTGSLPKLNEWSRPSQTVLTSVPFSVLSCFTVE